MSCRIESPEHTCVETTSLAAPDCPTPAANEPDPAASVRHALTTSAGLIAVTAASWRVTLPPPSGIFTEPGGFRRTWSRGPRR
jgi:hypothetical protein